MANAWVKSWSRNQLIYFATFHAAASLPRAQHAQDAPSTEGTRFLYDILRVLSFHDQMLVGLTRLFASSGSLKEQFIVKIANQMPILNVAIRLSEPSKTPNVL